MTSKSKRRMKKLETAIEKSLKDEIESYGYWYVKLSLFNFVGMPDRIIIGPNRFILFLEFKDYLFMTTRKGQVKKIRLDLFSKPRSSGVRIINLPVDNTDSVVDVKKVIDDQEVMLITKKGQAIRFNSKEVRSMGRASYGVTGIKLGTNDEVSKSSLPFPRLLEIFAALPPS